ncbi:MAG: hypothetical protein ACOH18_01205 [Candidatus Saccharimonadaceae bacterium]
MDNSQYHPPQTEHSTELYKQVEQHTIKSSPERLRSPFQIFTDVQNLVQSFRETAIALEESKGRVVKFWNLPISFVRPPRSRAKIMTELINNESIVGGQLFAEKNKYKFWYGDKGQSAISTPDVGDWYIEEINAEGSGVGVITHIETHPNHANPINYVKKFNHDGQWVPVTLSDLEIFVPAVYHYAHAILDGVEAYSFDRDRKDVILDGLEIPDDISALLPPEHSDVSKSDYYLAA